MRKSPTEVRAGERTRRVSVVLCDRIMNVKIKGECVQNSGKTSTGGVETWALKNSQENKLEVAEMRRLRWMCGVTKLDKMRNERIRGTPKMGEIAKKVQEMSLMCMVWACDEKRGALRGKEGDGNEITGEKEERKT